MGFTAIVDASVETFNQTAYKVNLALLLGVSPSAIVLTVNAASVRVTAMVMITDQEAAKGVLDTLSSAINGDKFDAALGVTVESTSTPTLREMMRSTADGYMQSTDMRW